MSYEIIFAMVVIVIVGILIFFEVKQYGKRQTYTVYVSRNALIAINAYRDSAKKYEEKPTYPQVTRRRVLRKLRHDVPNLYHYLLDEPRIEVKLYGEK